MSYRSNKERLEWREAQSLWELNDLPEQKVSPAISLDTQLSPASLSSCITGIAQRSGITKNQLVCTLIFHFLLLMALPTASALLTISHVSVLLSLHRCVWLSQMFLGLTVLAACSKAEPFKQLLCQLDFEMNQVKKACTVHCPAAKGSWNWAGTVVCLSLLEWFKRRGWFKSILRWLQQWDSQCWLSQVRGCSLLSSTHIIEMKRLKFTQESDLLWPQGLSWFSATM